MKDKPIIESAMKVTPEQREKNRKLKASQLKAENSKMARKQKNKVKKKKIGVQKGTSKGDCDSTRIDRTLEKKPIAGVKGEREANGTFAKGHTISIGTGRPPIFTDPDELAKKIDLYIDDCPNLKTCYTSEGIEYTKKVPTIAGLAFFLGFESRQSMYDYRKKENHFSYIIKRAMLFMENHYEMILQGKAPTGSIFALKNMGWKDKTEVDLSNSSPLQYEFILKPKEEE